MSETKSRESNKESKLQQFFSQIRQQSSRDKTGGEIRPFAAALTELVAGGQFTMNGGGGGGGGGG
jgi:hypothetical protein